MSDERPHLERYRDRQAHSEIFETLGPYPFMALVIGVWLIAHAVLGAQGHDALLAAASGAAILLLGFGIRSAKEWARRALVALFSLGIAVNLARGFGAPLGRLDASNALFYSFIGTAFLIQFAGAEAKERFVRARRFLARRDLERAQARAAEDVER